MVLICAALCGFSGSSAAQDHFNAGLCEGETEDGLVTIRLESGIVLRVRPDGFYLRDGEPISSDPRLPAYGCPRNPVHVRAAYLSYPFLPSGLATNDHRAGFPNLVRVFSHELPIALQDTDLELFRASQETFHECHQTAEDMTACWNCRLRDGFCISRAGGPPVSMEEVPVSILALPGAYAEQNGRRLVVNCGWGYPDGMEHPLHRQCSVRYKMAEGLLVDYDFDLVGVGLDHILAMDRQIRQDLLRLRVQQ